MRNTTQSICYRAFQRSRKTEDGGTREDKRKTGQWYVMADGTRGRDGHRSVTTGRRYTQSKGLMTVIPAPSVQGSHTHNGERVLDGYELKGGGNCSRGKCASTPTAFESCAGKVGSERRQRCVLRMVHLWGKRT